MKRRQLLSHLHCGEDGERPLWRAAPNWQIEGNTRYLVSRAPVGGWQDRRDKKGAAKMSLIIPDLATKLISDALGTKDGWPGRDGRNFSLTVTSEAAIAVAEFLEQSPQPRTETEAKRRTDALQVLKNTEARIRENLSQRIDDSDLEVWHYSMGLAAIANIRLLLNRDGLPLEAPDKAFIAALVQKIKIVAPDNPTGTGQIGSAWAFLRAMELLRRTRLAANHDEPLWAVLGEANDRTSLIGELAILENTLREQVLAHPITDDVSSYVAIVELDIAVSALKTVGATSQKRQYTNAKTRISEGLARLQSTLADHPIDTEFPLEKFDFDGDQSSETYVVIAGPTIVSSLAFALESGDYFNLENKQSAMSYFYSAIKTLSDEIDGGRFWGYGPSHCLRVLAEIQANKRDSDAALDALRGLRTATSLHGKDAARLHELEQYLVRSPLVFGKPGGRSFVAFSPRPLIWTCGLLLAIFIAITAFESRGMPWVVGILSAIPVCLTILLVFWNSYADLKRYPELPSGGKSSLKVFFLVGFFGILSGLAGIIDLILNLAEGNRVP